MTSFDAIILAGGRGTRLGGVDKAALTFEGASLLRRACDALAAAGSIVVVGETRARDVPERVERVREDPPFGGPAAGIGAGLVALRGSPAELVAVVACDIPHVGRAFPALLSAAPSMIADGLVAVDPEGRRQTLLGLYRRDALEVAAMSFASLAGVAVRALVASLILEEIALPAGTLRDVDDRADARELGVRGVTDGT